MWQGHRTSEYDHLIASIYWSTGREVCSSFSTFDISQISTVTQTAFQIKSPSGKMDSPLHTILIFTPVKLLPSRLSENFHTVMLEQSSPLSFVWANFYSNFQIVEAVGLFYRKLFFVFFSGDNDRRRQCGSKNFISSFLRLVHFWA